MTHRIDIADSLAYRIYRAQRLLRRDLFRIAARAGADLTPEQWFVLNKLRLRDGQAQVELGESIFADRPNMTRIVHGLQKRGLVERRRDPEDGRKALVHLTPQGKETHDRVAGVVAPERDRLFEGISSEQMRTAFTVLEQIERNVLSGSE
ncbi:MAG: MarR family transcriptional regulator [Deltaproteobacteria bacterium]|nr:MarR family transcriptional regulator [Deltaproteobacteria bacterium]